MHDIKAFLKSINFNDEDNILKDVEVKKVVLNKKNETFNVYLTSKELLPFNIVDSLINNKYKINNTYNCNIDLEYIDLNKEDIISYLHDIIKKIVIEKPSLISLTEKDPVIDDDIIKKFENEN